jgi:hypothetical protein
MRRARPECTNPRQTRHRHPSTRQSPEGWPGAYASRYRPAVAPSRWSPALPSQIGTHRPRALPPCQGRRTFCRLHPKVRTPRWPPRRLRRRLSRATPPAPRPRPRSAHASSLRHPHRPPRRRKHSTQWPSRSRSGRRVDDRRRSRRPPQHGARGRLVRAPRGLPTS